ncbi:uncharacterized protein LOC128883727 isoform X2 [Hylaeus volcanicus]|uniref:uncharacterized protein LOC128883727 isoform X2 n=1 Tax=Hylaeus volcanicus TaxID=313075 RepID=UPI0023B7CBBD|nr:uncharacterized protein LOC128883727 isoform X2 [Hylaeus volcanicus]
MSSSTLTEWIEKYQFSVIAHLDLDCFYAQVEQRRLNIPSDTPLAVYQWDGIIAVNYAAKKTGVCRGLRVIEAKKLCPCLQLVHVGIIGLNPSEDSSTVTPDRQKHKVCLKRYRDASQEVLDVLSHYYSDHFQRTSIDEVYIDLSTYIKQLLRSIIECLAPLVQVFKCQNFSSFTQDHNHSNCVQNGITCAKNTNGSCDIWKFCDEHGCPLWIDTKNANSACLTEPKQEIILWIILWLQWFDHDFNNKIESFRIGTSKYEILKNVAKNLFEDQTGLLYEIGKDCVFRSLILRNVDPETNTCIPFFLRDMNQNNFPLILGSFLVYKTRKDIKIKTGFNVSAGIAKTKFFAKRLSSEFKPNTQTILFNKDIIPLLKTIPLTSANSMRGKTGRWIAAVLPDVKYLYDIPSKYTLSALKLKFRSYPACNDFVEWLYKFATGASEESVRSVTQVKSMISCKTFQDVHTMEDLHNWIQLICADLSERLVTEFNKNQRFPKDFVLHITGGTPVASRTRSLPAFLCSFTDQNHVASKLVERMISTLSSRISPKQLFPCNRLGLGANLTTAQGQRCNNSLLSLCTKKKVLNNLSDCDKLKKLDSCIVKTKLLKPQIVSRKCQKKKKKKGKILSRYLCPSVCLPSCLET